MNVVLAALAGLATFGVCYGLIVFRRPPRLAPLEDGGPGTLEPGTSASRTSTPTRDRRAARQRLTAAVGAIGRRCGPAYLRLLPPARRDRARDRIRAAGLGESLSVVTYAERKMTWAALASAGAAILLTAGGRGVVPAVLVLALGFVGLDIRLARLARQRQGHIEADLPDFLDVLAVVVGAGLTFRQGLARISADDQRPLAAEFRASLRQLDLGADTRTVLADLAARVPSSDLATFVSAVLQAEELGVPLARTLRDLARDQRRRTAQAARQRAARAAAGVSFVVSTLIAGSIIGLVVTAMLANAPVDLSGLLGGG
jgi:tight adherence protein C